MSSHEEIVQQIQAEMYGTIQQALTLIISERMISRFCFAPDIHIAREKVLFLKGIRTKCEELMRHYRIHSPEEWKRYPEDFRECQQLRRIKRELKFLWTCKPKNPGRKRLC